VVSGGALLTIVVSYSSLFAQIASPAADTPGCAPVNNTKYICPAQSPEDLVPIPGTRWLFASSFRSGGMGIRLIDTGAKDFKGDVYGRASADTSGQETLSESPRPRNEPHLRSQ
jgi:hypothetical protein